MVQAPIQTALVAGGSALGLLALGGLLALFLVRRRRKRGEPVEWQEGR